MTIDKLVVGGKVLIPKGIGSGNLDEKTFFDGDVVGRVVKVTAGGEVVVDIPNYPKLRTYKIEDVMPYQE